jgi:hypothetical protein
MPNPTSGNVSVTINTDKSQEVSVDIYDVIGQKVVSSGNTQLTAGYNKIDFDLARLAAGTYSVTITAENQIYTKKLVIAK